MRHPINVKHTHNTDNCYYSINTHCTQGLQSTLSMIKYLYIVDYWVPFPQSEYGGVINVIAQSEDECYDLLSDPDEPFYNESFINRIRPAIEQATKLTLTDNYKSVIVDAFIT